VGAGKDEERCRGESGDAGGAHGGGRGSEGVGNVLRLWALGSGLEVQGADGRVEGAEQVGDAGDAEAAPRSAAEDGSRHGAPDPGRAGAAPRGSGEVEAAAGRGAGAREARVRPEGAGDAPRGG